MKNLSRNLSLKRIYVYRVVSLWNDAAGDWNRGTMGSDAGERGLEIQDTKEEVYEIVTVSV